MLLLIAVTLDYMVAVRQKSNLQAAADAAAIASAKGLGLSDARRENVASVAKAIVAGMIDLNTQGEGRVAIATAVRTDPMEVEVRVSQPTRPGFGHHLGLTTREISVRSVARIVGRPNVCVLALDQSASGAISLEKNANVTGKDCAVFSNSVHSNAIKAKNSASLTASLICSAGGKDGGPGNFAPDPLTDCPTFEDPLAGRPEPTAGPCMPAAQAEIEVSQVLSPGTYCGGLKIKGAINVEMRPGIYVIKDGPLVVDGPVRLTGRGVGLYFSGAGAEMVLGRETSIALEAPTDGVMAGLLIFGGRNQPQSTQFRILSDDARTLLGTIYAPNGEIYVDANEPIADQSAYTAIVARTMTLLGGPKLILNAQYDLTDVPVPKGIRGAGQPISLVK